MQLGNISVEHEPVLDLDQSLVGGSDLLLQAVDDLLQVGLIWAVQTFLIDLPGFHLIRKLLPDLLRHHHLVGVEKVFDFSLLLLPRWVGQLDIGVELPLEPGCETLGLLDSPDKVVILLELGLLLADVDVHDDLVLLKTE